MAAMTRSCQAALPAAHNVLVEDLLHKRLTRCQGARTPHLHAPPASADASKAAAG
eukprot:CAMPEP_0195060834 /NCGR_PEP_ID=MMETSP0448-20130528/7997_1 /TAXON_ID=66468 /ORGANISM="Heterocapsa triquestra, Strain CCMP 448" /LENGTH=54 /DNA_ID=CAMNT_0040091325 /DNA_START=251 /DNA_END=412 /DNA_ORIENTATION=-